MADLSNWTPRLRPEPERLEGRTVTLERYDEARHGQALWDGLGGPAVNDLIRYFPNPVYAEPAPLIAWLTGNQRDNVTMVYRSHADGAVCGMATYMRIDAANGVCEVGSIAHAPHIQRSVMATEAQYLMMRHVFEDLGYRRYEWKLNALNQPSHAAARRLGFVFEGVFRNHMVAKGQNRDTAWYAMLDAEWPLHKQAFELWLQPANFDLGGRQIRRLEAIREQLNGGQA
ncbi:MAG: GNAT family N-acetyltransferase [Phyllobacteriaceae bacterium]|nr:GNAT family N-acetyltransferase [Phyllobacteriaceae bacterium]